MADNGVALQAKNPPEPLFAVPGDLVSSSFLGTNNLIRNGAIPVFSPNDILEEHCHRYFDKLNNETRPPDDEIIRRAQAFLTDEAFLSEKSEKPKEPVAKSAKEHKAPQKTAVKKPAPPYLTENAAKVYAFIGEKPVHVDEIINGCRLTASAALSALTELEIYGLTVQLSGRRYKIN